VPGSPLGNLHGPKVPKQVGVLLDIKCFYCISISAFCWLKYGIPNQICPTICEPENTEETAVSGICLLLSKFVCVKEIPMTKFSTMNRLLAGFAG
jgi:hypothetical protein